MNVPPFLRLALVGVLSAGGFTSDLSAQVIYREIYGAPSGPDLSANVFDWQQFTSGGGVLTGNRINTSATSKPTDLANVNAGTNSDGSTGPLPNGLMFVQTAPANLAITTEYSFDPAAYDPGTVQFSWYAGNAGSSSTVQLTIRIDSTWYASTTTFSTPSTALSAFGDADPGGAQFQSIVFDPTASMWSIINFDGDYVAGGSATDSTLGALSLGASPGSDLSGTITGFGLYSGTISGGNTRFDTFQIAVVPEPSVFGLAIVGGLVLFGFGRRFGRLQTARASGV